MCGNFKLFGSGGLVHFYPQPVDQIHIAAVEEQFYILHGFLILLERRQAVYARTEATVNVVLQARPRTLAVNGDAADADKEVTLDQLDRLAGRAGWKKRTGIVCPVLPNPACDHGAWK